MDGRIWFRGNVPVPYPIPHDGPVGKLLLKLKQHPMRLSHMHFVFKKDNWGNLTTALYLKGDPYKSSDALFSVKESLIVELGTVDQDTATLYPCATEGIKLLEHGFVLVSEGECAAALFLD